MEVEILRDFKEVVDYHRHRIWKLRETASSKLSRKRDAMKESLRSKQQRLEQKINTPPFLRTSDKVAFTVGLAFVCITEFLILRQPSWMSLWYAGWLIPLMIARYVQYVNSKFQYFMLDFCYFAQLLLLASSFVFPSNSRVFEVVFAISNGPLAVGIVMWRNSIVFHDLDKLTSVFIHMLPALVTFTRRWYPSSLEYVCSESDCSLRWIYALAIPIGLYVFWQILYLFQVEYVDGDWINSDEDIMTSARWMSSKRPHPIWVFFHKRGAHISKATMVLVSVQFAYTFLTLLPVKFIFESFWLHSAYLSLLFIACVWNGANFYFEIFTETYTKRLKRQVRLAINRRDPIVKPLPGGKMEEDDAGDMDEFGKMDELDSPAAFQTPPQSPISPRY
eukprot:TRINITY_DN4092_c4_g1_i1.p1 TRINITY_DN4092_c4_g1~~TRINITY_DN4092_c4_g1_i1.p1  ORF type:complete len:391 (-),score=63.98 TRINITY_DN4092_c4_g1_i1:81-1253(-)